MLGRPLAVDLVAAEGDLVRGALEVGGRLGAGGVVELAGAAGGEGEGEDGEGGAHRR